MAKKKKTFKDYLKNGDMYLTPRLLFDIGEKMDLILKELKKK